MLLRKMQAYGFKSFAEKTELEFGTGITAIVGPNGSGKSNIADAIRWALGEQSMRSLRGSKLEDVIFAGSGSRRPLGVAEVSLTFDNTDGCLPVAYSEVVIARRIFRSGDSEYYINKTACRLKDIHELLADTGLGKDSMTVIGQNKIDELLNNKPEERRLLFEEAAGITKYKQRKREAWRKLENAEQNLVRVYDIVAEIESQLTPLAAEAKKAAHYQELCSELQVCQVNLFLQKLSKAENMLLNASREKEVLAGQNLDFNVKLAVSEAAAEKIITELAAADDELQGLEGEAAQLVAAAERCDGRQGVLAERLEQGRRSKERLLAESSNLLQQAAELAQAAAALTAGQAARQSEYAAKCRQLQEQESIGKLTSRQSRDCEEKLEAAKTEIFVQQQELAVERNCLRQLEKDLELITAKMSRQSKEQKEYAAKLQASRQQCQVLSNEQDELTAKVSSQQKLHKQLQVRRASLEEELRQCGLKAGKKTGHLQELTSRLKILTGMQQGYEGFGRGIRQILKCRSEAAGGWTVGICGAVAEVLITPAKYVTAIEIALGGALQHIIVQDEHTAKAAIAYLKAGNWGRATFLPLDTIQSGQQREYELRAAAQQGALGFAAALVDCDRRYRPVIDYLLGRTIIAGTIEAALALARQAAFRLKVVTLDGELLHPGGSLTGGALGRRETGFLSRKNEISDLQQQLVAAEKEMAEIRQVLSKLEMGKRGCEQQLAELTVASQEAEVKQAQLQLQFAQNAREENRLQLSAATVAAESETMEREQLKLAAMAVAARQRLLAGEAVNAVKQEEFGQMQQDLASLKKSVEELTAELTESKIKVSSLRQEIEFQAERLALQAEQQEEVQGRLLQLKKEAAESESQNQAAAQERMAAQKEAAEIAFSRKQCEEKRRQSYEQKILILAQQQQEEKSCKELRRRSQDSQNRLHEIELMITKYSYEATVCREQLQEQYGLQPEAAEALRREESRDYFVNTLRHLEREIAGLGQVNTGAIREYERLQQRLQFLTEQSQDLVAAQKCLTTLIQDMERTMSQQFRKAFRIIDGYFGEIFAKLFGGGKAKLALLEPGELLESGIDILVQPPGKKQQNLTLLSGGERALTVIALLFAFLAFRPAPFCVADEIDAALDEANVKRFGDFLREYAMHTQFIVVTHRKGTMEAADLLQGVTMAEAGVSRLISVKMADRAG